MMSSQVGRAAKGYLELRLGIGSAVVLGALAVLLAWSSPAAALAVPAVGSQSQPTVAASFGTSLALKADGSLWIWGYPQPPEDVGGLIVPNRLGIENDWVAVSDSWLLKADGSLWSWSTATARRTLGGDADLLPTPVRVGSDNDWAAVSAGAGAWPSSRTARCGSWTRPSSMIREVACDQLVLATRLGTDSDWAAVSSGRSYSFALKSDGSLWSVEYVVEDDSDSDDDPRTASLPHRMSSPGSGPRTIGRQCPRAAGLLGGSEDGRFTLVGGVRNDYDL